MKYMMMCFVFLLTLGAFSFAPERAVASRRLPRASGVYLGMKWEVDEDHTLWWQGKPYIPYASFGISPDNQVGVTEFNPWIDNDLFNVNPRLTRALHIEDTRRQLEAITKAGGTCLPVLAIASPVLPDGYEAAKSRAAQLEGGAVKSSAARLADSDVKRRIVKVWEEYAPALRQPCVRGLILWNEINVWHWEEQRSPEEHARVLGEYVKEAKRIFGDLPVVFKIAGTFNTLPVIIAAAKYADGLGFDVWFGSAEDQGARRQIGEALRLLRGRQTKTTWFFIAEGGRCAGPEHREGEGEYWDAWPPFRSAQEARDILRAYALQGVKGFIYNGPPLPSYRQSQRWFAQLKPEIVPLMRETKPRVPVPRIGNAQQAIAAAKADARVKKMLANLKDVETRAEISERYGVWLVHFSAAGQRVGFASVSHDGKVLEVASGEDEARERNRR